MMYIISRVQSQITLDLLSSDHVNYKNYSEFSKSQIGQWHLVILFSKMINLAKA